MSGGNWGENTLPVSPVIGIMLSTPRSLHGPTPAINKHRDQVYSMQRELVHNFVGQIRVECFFNFLHEHILDSFKEFRFIYRERDNNYFN